MKKLLFTLFIACFTVVFANAQDAPKKKTSFGWDKASLTEIGCNAETIKKIAAVKKEATAKRQKIDEDASLDEKAKKAAIKVVVKERNDAMMAFLNDEQKKKGN